LETDGRLTPAFLLVPFSHALASRTRTGRYITASDSLLLLSSRTLTTVDTMRSLAKRLLRILSDAGESPPDFLCPCEDNQRPQQPPQIARAGPSTRRIQRRTDLSTFPRQYTQGDDGRYTINPVFNYHGQSVVCTLVSVTARSILSSSLLKATGPTQTG